jgi:hypothetical protein
MGTQALCGAADHEDGRGRRAPSTALGSGVHGRRHRRSTLPQSCGAAVTMIAVTVFARPGDGSDLPRGVCNPRSGWRGRDPVSERRGNDVCKPSANQSAKTFGGRREVTDFTGAPEEIRTPDPQIRSLVLYPAELRALVARRGSSLDSRQPGIAIGSSPNWQGSTSCHLPAGWRRPPATCSVLADAPLLILARAGEGSGPAALLLFAPNRLATLNGLLPERPNPTPAPARRAARVAASDDRGFSHGTSSR